jgi:flagellar FliL protein
MAKDDEKEATEAKGGGKKKLILMVAPVLILVAAAGWFFLLKPSSAGAATTLPDPKPGVVVTMDATTINLSGGHFLKFGLALQPTASAKAVDGSIAMDLAINEFSGMTITELSSSAGRNAAKDELLARIKLAYLPEGKVTEKETAAADEKVSNGKAKTDAELTAAQAIKRADALTIQADVYNIYFTEFVMQ